jgi:hypothetical protein
MIEMAESLDDWWYFPDPAEELVGDPDKTDLI